MAEYRTIHTTYGLTAMAQAQVQPIGSLML